MIIPLPMGLYISSFVHQSMALQLRRPKTDWSGCCQMAVQGALWLAKRYPSTLISVFLTGFCYFSYQIAIQLSSWGWVDPIPDPILPEKFLWYSWESNQRPLGWQSDVLTTIPNRWSLCTNNYGNSYLNIPHNVFSIHIVMITIHPRWLNKKYFPTSLYFSTSVGLITKIYIWTLKLNYVTTLASTQLNFKLLTITFTQQHSELIVNVTEIESTAFKQAVNRLQTTAELQGKNCMLKPEFETKISCVTL